jgi:hypothetical protein
MCKEAREIQKLWKPKSGDIYHFKSAYNSLIPHILQPDVNDNIMKFDEDKKCGKFWLPSLEDLYTIMMEARQYTTWGTLNRFNFYYKENMDLMNGNSYLQSNTNIKIVWLKCIMETLYRKLWVEDKEKWTARCNIK